MAVAVLAVSALLPAGMPLVARLAVQVALGACVYFAVIFGFHRARIEVLLQLASSGDRAGRRRTPPPSAERGPQLARGAAGSARLRRPKP
jgi:hypothetical protein